MEKITAESSFVGDYIEFMGGKNVTYKVVGNPQVPIYQIVESNNGNVKAIASGYMFLQDNSIVRSQDTWVSGFPLAVKGIHTIVQVDKNIIALVRNKNLKRVESSKSNRNFSNFIGGSENATMKSNLVYLASASLSAYAFNKFVKVIPNKGINTLVGIGVGLGVGYFINKSI